MKKFLFFSFLILSTFTTLNAQSMLTFRDVYDFNVGDEFQTVSYSLNDSFPNAHRYKIIAKQFSANNDTVFYYRTYNNYYSAMNPTPSPHLQYYPSVGVDTVYYASLDSLISTQYPQLAGGGIGCSKTTDSLYYSSQFCNPLVYDWYSCSNCCSEELSNRIIFGKGLGVVMYRTIISTHAINNSTTLFYYKKGTLICGAADTSSVTGISTYNTQNSTCKIYPNPAQNNFTIETNATEKQTLQLFDVNGKQVLSQTINGTTNIDASSLNAGVYNISIISSMGIANKRLIIVK